MAEAIGEDLAALGLTFRISTRKIEDTRIEVLVDRLPVGSRRKGQMVSIADVGLGIGQVLPVLVALRAATPPHAVYIEQPELHLHPKAQIALAKQLCAAASRGVRVIVETHSSLLLRGIQTQAALGDLDPALVMLHWFERKAKDGIVSIRSSELDDAGAFGDWPMDFDDVSMAANRAYINAAFKRIKAS